jgi:hypothetical protein
LSQRTASIARTDISAAHSQRVFKFSKADHSAATGTRQAMNAATTVVPPIRSQGPIRKTLHLPLRD